MKVEIKSEEKTISKSYPYIGRHAGDTGLIVLFTLPGRGICLVPGVTSNKPWDYIDFWTEIDFTPFHGTITISNN